MAHAATSRSHQSPLAELFERRGIQAHAGPFANKSSVEFARLALPQQGFVDAIAPGIHQRGQHGQRAPRRGPAQARHGGDAACCEGHLEQFEQHVPAHQRQPGRKAGVEIHPERHQHRQEPQARSLAAVVAPQ
jgi:hypothetical protein